MMLTKEKIILLLFILFIYPFNAYAYLDPGTGSMLLQVLSVSFIAVCLFWRKIIDIVKNFFNKNSDD